MFDSFFNNNIGECLSNAVLSAYLINKLSKVSHA
jgi:hypothetical protein